MRGGSGEVTSDVGGSLFENVTFKPRPEGWRGATGWRVGEIFQAKITVHVKPWQGYMLGVFEELKGNWI